MHQPMIIFGASVFGKWVHERLPSDMQVTFYCDNNREKWGSEHNGLPIIAPTQLLEPQMAAHQVVIASDYRIEIAYQLFQMGISRFSVATMRLDDARQEYVHLEPIDMTVHEKSKSPTAEQCALIISNVSGSNAVALYKLAPDWVSERIKLHWADGVAEDSHFYESVLTSNVVCSTQAEYFFNLPQQIHAQLWHGFPLKTIGSMSKSDTRSPDAIRRIWNQYDLIFSYSDTYSSLMNACFLQSQQKYKITGMPRNDFLFHSEGRANLETLLQRSLADRRIVYYMPTYRTLDKPGMQSKQINGARSNSNLFHFEAFADQRFDQFLEEHSILLVMKLHPFEEFYMRQQLDRYQYKNIALLSDSRLRSEKMDLYETLNAADALITDYSSVYFDYLLLDRPLIFVSSDEQEYAANRGFLLNPYDIWTPGPKVQNQEQLERQLLASVITGKQAEFAAQRKIIRDISHQYQDGDATERVWQVLMNQ